ncbi:MAG TPA: arylsulfotransferase family protein [Solirubrobacteraceae bacterium]
MDTRPIRRRAKRGLILSLLLIALLTGGALAFAGRHIAGEQVAYSGPRTARCVPQQLNLSDLLPGSEVAVSPLPGSYDASPQTQISFLGVPASELSDVRAFGSLTGGHAGELEAYSQGDGASFVPAAPFRSGETVTVSGQVSGKPFSFHFTVAYPDPIPVNKQAGPRPEAPASAVQHFHTAPELEPPAVTVLHDSTSAAPGDIFLAPYSGPGRNGPTILDQQGQLVWMDPLPGSMKATNLQVESYEGKPVLTWWQGYIPPQGFGEGEEIVANTSYKQILHIKAGNGDLVDLHEFHLEPEDTAILSVFHTIHCDLTSLDGPRDAAVTDGLFQEIDVKTGLVRREWTSLDHVAPSESIYNPLKSTVEWPFDFFHINTVDPRSDGTTLISGRNTSALWLINTKTGQVIEKIGGRKSDVQMGKGTETAYQHDAMTLPDGDISIFDNGGTGQHSEWQHAHSRGVIVDVDLKQHTDTLVREFDHDPPLKAGSQGDVQSQPDGNYFIGWGQEPYFSEYTAQGELLYDARMWAEKNEAKDLETESYRTYKSPWQATPYWPPAIAAEHTSAGLTVHASWNGATEVSSWRVLGGSSRETLTPLTQAAKHGFETAISVPAEAYVEVEALDSTGAVIGHSTTIAG